MKNLAIIPARSGSKGLRDKNIRILNGKPLLAYSISEAKDSGMFSEIMVSTDSDYYADISKKYGATVPFLRSKALSGDSVGSWDVVHEVLMCYFNMGCEFDTVCLLQPTSPLRNSHDIIAGYQELKEKDADAITSVCEMDHSPQWSMVLKSDLSLTDFRTKMIDCPRQMLETYYRINGAIYIRKIRYDGHEHEIDILDKKEFAYIMDRKRSVDIDTMDDFEYASFLIQNTKNVQ